MTPHHYLDLRYYVRFTHNNFEQAVYTEGMAHAAMAEAIRAGGAVEMTTKAWTIRRQKTKRARKKWMLSIKALDRHVKSIRTEWLKINSISWA